MCTEHKSKDLELFCVDHDLPCCATCVSVNHRKCENVLTIEDAAKKFRETTSVDKLKNDVIILLADLEIILQSEKKSLSKVQEIAISQLKTYDEFWTHLEQKLDNMKKNQTKQYQMQFDTEKSKLEASISSLENKKKTVANTKQILEVTEKEASNVQVMIEVQKIKRQIDQHKLGLQGTSTISEIEFQFSKNVDEVDKMLEKICILNCNRKSLTLDLSSVEAELKLVDTSSSSSEVEDLLNVSMSSECSDDEIKCEFDADKKHGFHQDNVQLQREHVPTRHQRKVHDWGQKKVAPAQLDKVQNWPQERSYDLQKEFPTTKKEKVRNRENETFEWMPSKVAATKSQKIHEWQQDTELTVEMETVSEKKHQKETTSNQSNIHDCIRQPHKRRSMNKKTNTLYWNS
ncbi:unnamed protein product [Mytilus coruscus]|uniref:B box-type domain-containing protein n=1 Tax=Mytilus coruscus TaxID=42192 RepID=A0A6J8BI54_MYTCO|nr:unnamed protein product [Mytilus coruscus]